MSSLFSRGVLAALLGGGNGGGGGGGSGPYWPASALGQNVPSDSSYSGMPIFNDRALCITDFFDTTITTGLPQGSRDPTTGLPTTAFGMKFAEGSLAQDPMVTGTWFCQYTAASDPTPTLPYGGSIISNTFVAGVGKIQIAYTAGSGGLCIAFHAAITSVHMFMPATSATAIASGPAAVPRWATQYLRSVVPYSYMRFMDFQATNQGFQTPRNGGSQTGFKTSVAWADRSDPSLYFRNWLDNYNGGCPVEWLVDLCNTTGKDGWFHIPILATDDYVTNFVTYVAQNLNAGLKAVFAFGNEVWNALEGSYTRAMWGGMTDALARQSTAVNQALLPMPQVSSFAVDASNNCTVTFTSAHGGTAGITPVLKGMNTGYATLAATGPMTTPTPTTIVYPCTFGSATTIPSTTAMTSTGFIALNPSSSLLTSASNTYDLRTYFYPRRSFEMATLARAAFTTAGRTQAECQPVLELHAGDIYYFGNKHISDFITNTKSASLSSVFKAAAVGGYLQLSGTTPYVNPGFGLTKTATDASLTTEAAVAAQIQQVCDAGPGAFAYTSTAAWCAEQGLELWAYEIGWDLSPAGGADTTALRAAKEAWQYDYTTYGAMQEALVLKWLRNLQRLGFKRIGWYQCGAGVYSGNGCFNLGQTANEIDYTTAPSGQSPKFRALLDSKNPPGVEATRHAFPCVLSAWDYVGNEAAVVTGGVWPALNGTNVTYGNLVYCGPGQNGITYEVWSETAQTVTCSVVGDNTSSTNRTVTVTPLGGSAATFSAPHNTVSGPLGSCSIALVAGINWVFISCSTAPANIFLHTVQFS